MIALLLASTVSAATIPKAVNNRPRRPRRYRDVAVFIVNLLVAIAKSARGQPGLCFGASRPFVFTIRRLLKAIDRLEASVRLDHGQEHLIRTPIAGGAVGQLETAEIERAGFLHGLGQRLPGGLAADLFERGDDRPPGHVALKRDEARLGVGSTALSAAW